MDPTNSHGTLFSHKGPQNHQISNQWKECVVKENSIAKAWKEKHGADSEEQRRDRHGADVEEQEGRLLLASLKRAPLAVYPPEGGLLKMEREAYRRRALPPKRRRGAHPIPLEG
eukprot:gene37890-19591_t